MSTSEVRFDIHAKVDFPLPSWNEVRRMNAKKVASKGAKLLDEMLPLWPSRIDVATLDMESPHQCILGQLYGDYTNGLTALDMQYENYDRRYEYGFSLKHTASFQGWKALRQAWLEEIDARINMRHVDDFEGMENE